MVDQLVKGVDIWILHLTRPSPSTYFNHLLFMALQQEVQRSVKNTMYSLYNIHLRFDLIYSKGVWPACDLKNLLKDC